MQCGVAQREGVEVLLGEVWGQDGMALLAQERLLVRGAERG